MAFTSCVICYLCIQFRMMFCNNFSENSTLICIAYDSLWILDSRKDTVTTSSVATAPQPPPPPPPVPWANRRFYPIGNKDWLMARDYFGEASPVVMDAKKMGNLGRYFNHSCEPNVAVQNVFINSHDPRFPEVAFFATRSAVVCHFFRVRGI